MSDLPAGWEWATLDELCDINPRGFRNPPSDTDNVSVVPMAAVEAESGVIDASRTQGYGVIKKKSLTRFQEQDVLFAKITPCMENGKIAVAKGLHGGRALGSTEFHVLRSLGALLPEYLCLYLLQPSVRADAERNMTGAVGQRRVPRRYLAESPIPVPPIAEQRRIVATLEDHLSRLDAADAALGSAERRVAVLSQARIDQLLDELAGQPSRTLATLLREPLRNGYSGRASPDGKGVRTLALTAVTKAEFSDRFTKMSSVSGRKIDDLWLEPGDILVQRSNTPDLVGTSALYSGPRNWAIFPDLLIRVRTNDEVLPEYVRLALSSRRIHSELKRSAKGLAGSMPKIDQGTLARISLPVPSLSTQERVVALSEAMRAGLERLRSDLVVGRSRSGRLRRSLLADAFAGRLLLQDPRDEPASVLLERTRAQRAAQPKTKRTRRTKANPAQEALL